MRGAQTHVNNDVVKTLVTAWKRKIACSPLSRGCLFSLRMRHPFFPSRTTGSFCKFKFSFFFSQSKRSQPSNVFCSCWKQKMVWFGLVSLFNGISTFEGYLMPKPFSEKNSSSTIQPIAGSIRGFIPFPRVFARKWT